MYVTLNSSLASMSFYYSCPLSLLLLSIFILPLPLSLSLSRLDVVEWVKAARLRRSTSHAQPSVQRVLGGRVQRVVLREGQHHCISLRVCS